MKIPFNNYVIVASLAVLSVTGCSHRTLAEKGHPMTGMDYDRVNMSESEVMPSLEELRGRQVSIIVLPVNVDSHVNVGAEVIRHFSSELKDVLKAAGLDIIESSQVMQMNDTIKALAATGELSGINKEVADAAILPLFLEMNLTRSFSPASSFTDDNRLTKPSFATCNFKARATGKLTLFDLSTGTINISLILDGMATASQPLNNENCPLSKDDAFSLLTKAADEAINFVIPEIQHRFGRPGFVIEYRIKEGLHLVNFVPAKGQIFQEGQKIDFATRLLGRNYLGGEPRIRTIQYDFQGVVSEIADDNTVWVVVDKDAEGQLKKGDLATLHYNSGCYFGFFNTAELLNNLKRDAKAEPKD